MSYKIETSWNPGFKQTSSGFLRISASQISVTNDLCCKDLVSLKSRPAAKIGDGYIPIRYPEFETFPLGIVRESLLSIISQGLLKNNSEDLESLAEKFLDDSISKIRNKVENSHRKWALQALINYLNSFEKTRKEDEKNGLFLDELELIQAFDIDENQHVEWFVWGIFVTNSDNTVRELRLLKFSNAGIDSLNEVKIGAALRVLIDGVSHSESNWNIAREPVSKANENLKLVRIREFGCLDESVALIYESGISEARNYFEKKSLPIAQELVKGGTQNPNKNCRGCKANHFCPTLPIRPGLLGITAFAPWPKSYSPSKFHTYRKCPRQYFLQDELGLRTKKETTSSVLQRGLLVHSWLEKAHSRNQKCSLEDLLNSDIPGEVSSYLSWTNKEIDITKDYITQHISICPLTPDSKSMCEVNIQAFDTDSDITVGTRPDLLLVKNETLHWREVKTSLSKQEIDKDLYFEIYPQLPLAIRLVHENCVPKSVIEKIGNYAHAVVELELITPNNVQILSWDLEDTQVLNKSWSTLAEQVDHWASDTLFAPSSNPPCNWCVVKDFCEFANSSQVKAEIDGLQVDLKTGEIIEVSKSSSLSDEQRVAKALGLSASLLEQTENDEEIPF